MIKEKGITLIALIITIIIMLILVTVTITMAVNGKLFDYAGKAARDTELAKQDELKLAEGSLKVDGKIYDTPEDFIDGVETSSTPKYSAKLLDKNGLLTKNAKYESNGKQAVIPKGFKISNVTSEQSIDDGLVIEDAIGNEFVWIPVPEGLFIKTYFYNNMTYEEIAASEDEALREEFFAKYKNRDYKLQNNNTYTEAIENNTDIEDWEDIVIIIKRKIMADYSEPYNNASTWEVTDYNNIVASVEKYGGFYIGRYEAGSTTPRTSGTPGTTNLVVKRDAYPYNWVCWGVSMNDYETPIIYTADGISYNYGYGAVALSKNMYNDSTKYGVSSTLCYWVQWDAMLRFIKDSTHNVNSSSDWGNYSNTDANIWKITRTTAQYYKNSQWNVITEDLTKATAGNVLLTAGANDNFQAKNIYDVAGNLLEWTMKSYSNTCRLFRGGYYNAAGSFGSGYSASSTYNYFQYPPDCEEFVGFRPTLYILD